MEAKNTTMGSKATLSDKKKNSRCKVFLRKFFKFIFSNVGLLCLLCGYTVMGAYAFMMLEGGLTETLEEIDIENETASFLDALWNMTEVNGVQREDWKIVADGLLKNYTVVHAKYEESASKTDVDGWTFLGSLVFCTTVTTSIGYGYIAPETMGGRIFCMIYATFGIPLMFVVLINVGTIFADLAKCAFMCWLCKKKKVRPVDAKTWADKTSEPDKVSLGRPNSGKHVNIRDIAVEEQKRDEEATQKNLQVPIIVILLILTGYNCLGMLLFSAYMPWTFLESFYFSYITLSTVGFGDLIISDLSDPVFLCISAIYMLIGLAVVSMCITLLTERFVSLAMSIGKAIGLVQDEDGEEAEK